MAIYAYENYRNRRVTIHDGSCRDCNNGEGKNGTGPTPNGKWWPPFATVTEAEAAVTGRQPTIRRCRKCLR